MCIMCWACVSVDLVGWVHACMRSGRRAGGRAGERWRSGCGSAREPNCAHVPTMQSVLENTLLGTSTRTHPPPPPTHMHQQNAVACDQMLAPWQHCTFGFEPTAHRVEASLSKSVDTGGCIIIGDCKCGWWADSFSVDAG